MHSVASLALLAGIATSGATTLSLRTIPVAPPISSALIVGRAACGGTTWLLSEQRELLAFTHATRRVRRYHVTGLRANDRPWSLACVGEGTLWTLATSHAMVRLAPDGAVRERVDVPWPRVVLFGWLNRVVFQQLPVLAAAPVLMTSPPQRPLDLAEWPGLRGRATAARRDLVSNNLVNCGIGMAKVLPCWFADDTRVAMSDGATVAWVTFGSLRGRGVDQSAPIWDLAVAGPEALWLLAARATPSRDHRLGGRLIRANHAGIEQRGLDLPSGARVILAATETASVLLAGDGTIVEVNDR
jgi:hypothetical protein